MSERKRSIDDKKGKKSKKGISKNETDQPSSSKNFNQIDDKSKSEKKSIRFKDLEPLPLPEAVASTTSDDALEKSNENLVEEILMDERKREMVSVLKNFASRALKHSNPSEIIPSPCFHSDFIEEEFRPNLPLVTSSKQLFEIYKISPTPSDYNMNLINAIYLRRLEKVKQAINNGANVNVVYDGFTPLLLATESGNIHVVSYLLAIPNVHLNKRNNFGQTALMVAVIDFYDEIAKLLLNNEADPNIADNLGNTPLHEALNQQRAYMAKLLLLNGANIELKDCFGEKPIYIAAVKRPDVRCLKVLLEQGACPDYFNRCGLSLVSRVVISQNNLKIIQMLVEYGASTNIANLYTKKTPLHFAARINNLETAMFLVGQGASTEATTVYNFTPYKEAIFFKSLDVAEFLSTITENANKRSLAELKAQKLKKVDIYKKLPYVII